MSFKSAALLALCLPAVLILIELLPSQHPPYETAVVFVLNWAEMAAPQLFVVALASLFPRLRAWFAVPTLVMLSGLVLLFGALTIARGGGLNTLGFWLIYIVLAPFVIILGAAFLPKTASRA